MGFFSKVFSAAASKSSAVVKHGAKQAQKGKTGPSVNAFSKSGRNAQKQNGNKR